MNELLPLSAVLLGPFVLNAAGLILSQDSLGDHQSRTPKVVTKV